MSQKYKRRTKYSAAVLCGIYTILNIRGTFDARARPVYRSDHRIMCTTIYSNLSYGVPGPIRMADKIGHRHRSRPHSVSNTTRMKAIVPLGNARFELIKTTYIEIDSEPQLCCGTVLFT